MKKNLVVEDSITIFTILLPVKIRIWKDYGSMKDG